MSRDEKKVKEAGRQRYGEIASRVAQEEAVSYCATSK